MEIKQAIITAFMGQLRDRFCEYNVARVEKALEYEIQLSPIPQKFERIAFNCFYCNLTFLDGHGVFVDE